MKCLSKREDTVKCNSYKTYEETRLKRSEADENAFLD